MAEQNSSRALAVVTLVPTMSRAVRNFTYLTVGERQYLMDPITESLELMRVGKGGVSDWARLCDAANIGAELSGLRICSDNASRQILKNMLEALGNLARRVNAGKPYTMTGPELSAIREGVERFDIQLEYTTSHDLRKALDRHQQHKARARAGKVAALTVTTKEGVPA